MAPLSEVIFGTSEAREAKRLRRLLQSKKVRRIASRIYTTNLADPPETIIRDNVWAIVGHLFPNTVISHRTALEGGASKSWQIFLTGPYPRKMKLPGLTVTVLKGPAAGVDDKPFMESLFMASEPRAFLENLQISRPRGESAKTITRKEIEVRLDRILRLRGEKAINALRGKAREVAKKQGFRTEFQTLDKIIGALLLTKPASELRSSIAKARALGQPYDPERLRRFEVLFSALKQTTLRESPEILTDSGALRTLAFFETYFSNSIEGTQFEVDEARRIVFEGRIPKARPQDAHDVLGTYRVVSRLDEYRRLPTDFAGFWTLLASRHEAILNARPEARPGEAKTEVNRAGETVFVAPDLVKGTLAKGFEFYRVLESPSSRAAFMMFLVSEVHPFSDGNGRIARVMMNAELVAAGLRRGIIPTVFRDDYLGSLRALSRKGDPTAYLRMLDRAQEFSASIDFSDMATALRGLTASNAFKDPKEGLLEVRPRPEN
jgi:hypothetical protein